MTTTEAAIAPGSAAPELQLDSAAGVPVRMAGLWTDRPAVFVFIGDPKAPTAIEAAGFVRDAEPVIEQAGAVPACVIRGSQADANSLARQLRLSCPLLCDATGSAAEAFGVSQDRLALFVVDTGGTVRFSRVAAGTLDLPSAQDVALTVSSIAGGRPPAAEAWRPGAGAQPFAPPQKSASGMLGAGVFKCAKCGNAGYEISQLSTAGGWLSRIFNFQYRKFAAVSCSNCSYTELYKRTSGAVSNIADILMGG